MQIFFAKYQSIILKIYEGFCLWCLTPRATIFKLYHGSNESEIEFTDLIGDLYWLDMELLEDTTNIGLRILLFFLSLNYYVSVI